MTLDHGEAQVTEYSAFGVGPVRFRHNSYINGQKFSLTYRALDQASVNLIRNHYTVNSGVAGEFSVPMVLFGGRMSSQLQACFVTAKRRPKFILVCSCMT